MSSLNLSKLTSDERQLYPNPDLIHDLEMAESLSELPQKYSQVQIESLSDEELNMFRDYFKLPDSSRLETIARTVRILRFMGWLNLSQFLDIFAYEWVDYPKVLNNYNNRVYNRCKMLRATDDSEVGDEFDAIIGQVELFMYKEEELTNDGSVVI